MRSSSAAAAATLITGNLGNDIIDGDAWLNVRIAVHANKDGTGDELFSVDSLTEIQARMLSGEINPGQLKIVREILYGNGPNDTDTAVFSGPRANYTIGEPDAEGRRVIIDNVGTDGVDTIRNIERLQFSDELVVLAGTNQEPIGLLTISDATPTEDQLLTVSAAGVTDPDNPGGTITGPISYVWQVERTPGVFTDVATGPTFRPGDAEVGLSLRVKATYQDANGVIETGVLGADGAGHQHQRCPDRGADHQRSDAHRRPGPVGRNSGHHRSGRNCRSGVHLPVAAADRGDLAEYRRRRPTSSSRRRRHRSAGSCACR